LKDQTRKELTAKVGVGLSSLAVEYRGSGGPRRNGVVEGEDGILSVVSGSRAKQADNGEGSDRRSSGSIDGHLRGNLGRESRSGTVRNGGNKQENVIRSKVTS